MSDENIMGLEMNGGRADLPGFSTLDVLTGMLAASNDACWCMEFSPPVDLTAADEEVVHQIFANNPIWRHCNAAMEQLYRLPAGESLTSRPVHEVFPNNPSNVNFVRNLIANGFEVDASPALDVRYDGLEIYVENDVRAHISDGRLYRMFGTVRNVDKHRRREHALTACLSDLQRMIAAVPFPFLAVDSIGAIKVMNVAGASWLEAEPDVLVGQPFEAALRNVDSGETWPEVLAAMARSRALAIPVMVQFADTVSNDVWHMAPWETGSGTGCVVMILPDSRDRAQK